MAGFNPFTGMGVNPNDPNMVRLLGPLLKVPDVPDVKNDADVDTRVSSAAKYVEFSSIP